MEEEMLEQEQQQDVPVEAPESVSEPLSQESNTMAQGQVESPVTEANADDFEIPASLSFAPVSAEQAGGLSLKDKLIVDIEEGSFKRIKNESLDKYAEIAAKSFSLLTDDLDEDTIKKIASSDNGPEILRQKAQVQDEMQRSVFYSDYISQQLADQNVDNQEIARLLLESREIKPNRAALEENATTALLNDSAKDPEKRDIYENSQSVVEMFQDSFEEQVLLYNKMEELREKAENDFDYGLDFIRGLTSLNSVSKILGWGTDWENEILEMRKRFRSAKTTEEKIKILDESEEQISRSIILGFLSENPDYTEEVFRLAFAEGEFDREFAGSMAAFEVGASLLAGAGAAAKGAAGLSKSGLLAAKKKLGSATGEEVMEAASKNPEDVKDVLAMKMPQDEIPSQYNKVKQEVEKQRQALQQFEENNVAPVMRTEAEQFPVFDQGNIRSQFYANDEDIITEFVTAKGNPFASKASAKQRASRLGLKEDSYDIVEENGGFVIHHKTKLDEFGAPLSQPRPVSLFTAKLRNVDSFIDGSLHQKGGLSEAAFAAYTNTVLSVWKNGIGKMRPKERRDMERVLIVLRDRNTNQEGFNRWFTEDEFIQEYRAITNNEPSSRVLLGYQTYKQLSDFAWRVDNQVEYKRLIDGGYSGYQIDISPQPIAAKEATNVGEDTIVYNSTDGTEIKYAELDSNKFDVLEVDTADMADMIEADIIPITTSRYIAVTKGKAKQAELDPFRIPYLAGGRVFYDKDSMFLKQATVVETSQGLVRGKDRTLYRASTKAEAEDFAKRFNMARLEAKKYKDGGSVPKEARANFLAFGLGSIEDFLQNAKARKWDLDQDVSVVGNRQRVEVGTGPSDPFADLEVLPEGIGNRFSKRGQGVPHVLGDIGDKPLDPLAALSESVNLTGRNAAYSTYRQFSLETLKRKFGRYLDVPENAPLRSYLDAPVNRKAQEDGMVNATKAHQRYVQDVVGMRTFDEKLFDRYVDKASEWAFGKDFGPISGRTVTKGLESLKGRSPIDLARKVMFNAYMGMLNVGVMALQASLAPVVAATVPRYGFRALANYPLFRAMLIGSTPTDGGLAKYIGQKAKTVDEALDVRFIGDLDDAVQEFRNLGIYNFDANLIYTDAAIGSNRITAMTSGLRGAASRVAAVGRTPFNESELMPRIVSYMAARAEWISNKTFNPKGLPPSSNAGRQWIRARTDKYVFGMSRADVQLGLRGNVAGAVFQFQSYVWRASDAFFNRTFTKGEKIRMAMAYIALFGTGALPIPYSQTVLDSVVDGITDDPEQRLALKQGVFDGAASAALGYETVFRDRSSLGKYWRDWWDAVTGERNFLELAGGPSGQTGHRAFDGMFNIMRTFGYMENPQVDDFTEEMVLAVATNISSVNNVYKAWVAWDTGLVLTRNGTPLVRMTREELVGQVFGFPSAKYTIIDEGFNSREASKEVKDAYTQDLLRLYRLWFETQDEDKKKEYEAAIKAVSNSAHERGFGREVSGRVLRSMSGEDMYYRMSLEYMKNYMEGEDTTDPDVIQQIKEIERADAASRQERQEQ